jgi:hypothetical protein
MQLAKTSTGDVPITSTRTGGFVILDLAIQERATLSLVRDPEQKPGSFAWWYTGHMVLIGASWLIYWILYKVFSVAADKAALATAIIFIVAGLILGERPWTHRP